MWYIYTFLNSILNQVFTDILILSLFFKLKYTLQQDNEGDMNIYSLEENHISRAQRMTRFK